MTKIKSIFNYVACVIGIIVVTYISTMHCSVSTKVMLALTILCLLLTILCRNDKNVFWLYPLYFTFAFELLALITTYYQILLSLVVGSLVIIFGIVIMAVTTLNYNIITKRCCNTVDVQLQRYVISRDNLSRIYRPVFISEDGSTFELEDFSYIKFFNKESSYCIHYNPNDTTDFYLEGYNEPTYSKQVLLGVLIAIVGCMILYNIL